MSEHTEAESALDADHELERRRLAARLAADETVMWRSLERLRGVGEMRDLDAAVDSGRDDALVRAVRRIGRIQGFALSSAVTERGRGLDALAALTRSAGVNMRALRVDGPGLGRGAKPILAFARPASAESDTAAPVVVLPSVGRRAPSVWHPQTDATVPLSECEIEPVGFEFYPPLQSDGDLSYRQVGAFTFAGSRRELFTILLVALGIGVFGLASPFVTRHVFGIVVPERETQLLWVAGGGLVLVAVAIWAFSIVQGLAVTRVSLRAEQRLQPAVWARVLSLPASFFRDFSSGELAGRVLGADEIRQSVSPTNVGVVLTAVFSLVNLALMYDYDVALGAAATLVLLVTFGVTALFGRKLIAQTAAIMRQFRTNAAHISDVLEGLSAIRTAAAEMRFFALHAELVRRKTVLQAQAQRTAIGLQAFYAGVTTVAPAVFITVIAIWRWDGDTGTAEVSAAVYLAFTTAFSTVLASLLALSALIQPLATAPPTLASMRPIFATAPEYDASRRDAGELEGRIELRRVSFRYAPESRWVARELSLVAEPGQFVALVGPSGAGKSTIMRLLLGFETPTSGSILYDAHNLREVDLSSVRSQLGVVLQDAQPFGGSVLDNIVGARPMGPDEAWAALDAAGLGDEVRAMPMNLHTQVALDGSTLSGGQLQRLLIARALVTQPRVLLLDEATSHLDDTTQTHVSESIAGLGITRIVIAHRLSTIRAADKICVLGDGQVVEEGTYSELMDQGGAFAALARRQLV